MRKDRIEALNAAGVNTARYFTLTADQDIPAGTKINIVVELPEALTNDPVVQDIIQNGYVKNNKIHRRWICAHYMKLLNDPRGWHASMNRWYDYNYQFSMMEEEIRVISKLEKHDRESFIERSSFFTINVVKQVLADYLQDMRKYLFDLPTQRSRRGAYLHIPHRGHVNIDNLRSSIIEPIENAVSACLSANTYDEMYLALKAFNSKAIALPANTKKSKRWVNAFQANGAFYTLQNLIRFHNVRLFYDNRFYNLYEAEQLMNTLISSYEGYQWNALLKKTIEKNEFDFKRSLAEQN